VKYLLDCGAHDPNYKTYPFLDSLITIAEERGHHEIGFLLRKYQTDPSAWKFKGDNGEILYNKTQEEQEFQRAVNHNKKRKVKRVLKDHPEFAKDEDMSWSEGILMMLANRKNKDLLELLLSYGAKVPDVSKWGRVYCFTFAFLLKKILNSGIKTKTDADLHGCTYCARREIQRCCRSSQAGPSSPG
jgi:hypothetical protein